MGVGVRVIAGERTGYAYSDDLSPEKIRKAARVAASIAAGPSKIEKLGLNDGATHNLYPVLTAPTETAFLERVELVKRADRAARAYDPRIFQVQASLRRQPPPGDGGHQRRSPHGRPAAAGAPERGGAGAAGWRRAAARASRRGRARRAGLFPQREDPRVLRRRSRARGRGHAGCGGGAGRRNDGGAGARLAGHSAARSRGTRPGSGFQPQGSVGLQRAHGAEGGQRVVHRNRRRRHRQPARVAQRGRRRPRHRSATCSSRKACCAGICRTSCRAR